MAIDMSPAYQEAVRTNLAAAVIVFDHFHVVKLFNEKLTDLRRAVYNQALGEQRKVLKGVRWLLLKAAENLSDERDEKTRLKEALELNAPLAMAYYLKEDLRQFWGQANKATAEEFLKIGSHEPRRRPSANCCRWQRPWINTVQDSWPTSTTPSVLVRSKGQTTRSKR